MVILLLACQAQPDAPDAPVAGEPEPLSDAALLRRTSLDLRGRPPSPADLLALEADPDLLESLLDDYVADPAFGRRLMDRYALTYRTRADLFVVGVNGDYDLMTDPASKMAFIAAVGQEPLRILKRIADDDLPYTDLVTADWTMSTQRLIESWPQEALEEPDADGWMMTRYTDERPSAGALVANGMWWRYTSTTENRNRGRAEAIARIFLCDGRFSAAIDFDLALSNATETDLQDRVFTDGNCTGCHVALEPLGSYLWGFWRNHPESFSEAAWYYPGRENLWQSHGQPQPAYYGQPGESLYDLGQQIAADPRLSDCAVEQGFSGLLGRQPQPTDNRALIDHREAFIASGLQLRALYRSLIDNPLYRSGDPDFEGTTPVRLMSPAVVASQLEALTGFVWTWEGGEMMASDTTGLRLLAGGADGLIAQAEAADYSLTITLVQQRIAEAAASYAVQEESVLSAGERTLFTGVDDLASVPDDDAMLNQIDHLSLTALSRLPTDDERDSLAGLWEDLHDLTGDPEQSWAMVLSALFRHPDFFEY
ncbi:MAG: hypothetical protein ACI8RZ_006364 [Myxococcota bacterium]|jgi:hypothetical protein